MLHFLREILFSDGALAREYFSSSPLLRLTLAASDLALGTACFFIAYLFLKIPRKYRVPFVPLFRFFAVFFFVLGARFGVEIFTWWYPSLWVSAILQVLLAIVAIVVSYRFIKEDSQMGELSESMKVASEGQISLQEAHRSYVVDSGLFRRLLSRNVYLPLTFCLLLCGILTIQFFNMTEVNNRVRISYETVSSAERSIRLIVDAETSFRGFMVTGNKIFLEPYERAIRELPDEFTRLRNLVVDSQRHLSLIDQTEDLYQEWAKTRDRYLADRNRGRKIDLEFAFANGKKQMDAIRAKHADFQQASRERLSQRTARSQATVQATLFFTIAITILLGGLLSLFGRKQLRLLSESYDQSLESLRQARDHLEAEVTKRTQELMNANAELESFSYTVSHDLRAPLRGIDGFSQALVEDYSDRLDEPARDYLAFIREGVQKMGLLIDNLLRLSRLSRAEINRRPCDMAVFATRIVKRLAFQESHRRVEFRNIEDGRVMADPVLLEAVLENLVGNAWKFSSQREVAKIEFGKELQNGRTVYFIRDNGAGFDNRYSSKLFEAFQRLHSNEEFKGTGVGLVTVKRILTRHGGEIWAESEVDKGATFFFTI